MSLRIFKIFYDHMTNISNERAAQDAAKGEFEFREKQL